MIGFSSHSKNKGSSNCFFSVDESKFRAIAKGKKIFGTQMALSVAL